MADTATALRGQDKALAASLQPVADDLLGPAGGLRRWRHRIGVGRVQESDAILGSLVHDGEGSGLIALMSEGHGPETDFRNLQAGSAHAAGFHGYVL